jgi:hypothetical protein
MSTGPRSSMGLPSTSMMRPSVALPTGTVMGAGVADHQAAAQAVGRAQRDGAHHAVAQLLLHFQRQRRAFELERVIDAGHGVRGNSTSTTAPMHWTILPCALCHWPFQISFKQYSVRAA